MFRSVVQSIIIAAARPYISRELPGWGKVHRLGVNPDWLWSDAPTRLSRDKMHGYLMHLNLSEWPDRFAYFLGRWHDLPTQLCMAKFIRPGDTVIDVGANRGMFALAASKLVGDSGRVISFEPNPDCILALAREVSINAISNIEFNQYALGSRDEELSLVVPVRSSDQGTLSNKFDGRIDVKHIKTHIRIGDEVLQNESPAFIKIDVEGFESNVINGLRNAIGKHAPTILTEINPQFLESCGSSVAKFFTLMSDLGYKGHKIALEKHLGTYDLVLSPITETVGFCDVVWLPISNA